MSRAIPEKEASVLGYAAFQLHDLADSDVDFSVRSAIADVCEILGADHHILSGMNDEHSVDIRTLLALIDDYTLDLKEDFAHTANSKEEFVGMFLAMGANPIVAEIYTNRLEEICGTSGFPDVYLQHIPLYWLGSLLENSCYKAVGEGQGQGRTQEQGYSGNSKSGSISTSSLLKEGNPKAAPKSTLKPDRPQSSPPKPPRERQSSTLDAPTDPDSVIVLSKDELENLIGAAGMLCSNMFGNAQGRTEPFEVAFSTPTPVTLYHRCRLRDMNAITRYGRMVRAKG
ncbi:MAG: hypothetical protein MMC33_005746 [Icmadophila ericetorum]|nr:hypothetical protein [Icmadophila ericetorum]